MEYRPRSLGALESLTILLIDFLPQKQKQKLNNFEKNKKKWGTEIFCLSCTLRYIRGHNSKYFVTENEFLVTV